MKKGNFLLNPCLFPEIFLNYFRSVIVLEEVFSFYFIYLFIFHFFIILERFNEIDDTCKNERHICGALRDWVPFVQFRKREKHQIGTIANHASTNGTKLRNASHLAVSQLTFTCSKSTTEGYRKRCKICSKLTIKTPKQCH